MMQIRADRHSHRPYGLAGGEAAAPSINILNPDTAPESLPSKTTREIGADTVLRHEQAGGGGYGDPLLRDPILVLEDVVDGKISADFARRRFGVVLDGGAVSPAATAALRERLQSERRSPA
jgi:N-methylhydantoinase B